MKSFCLTIVTILISISSFSQTNTWTGSTSRHWSTGSNWSEGHEPTSSEDVVIPSGTLRSPLISSYADCRDLTIQTGADLELDSIIVDNYVFDIHRDMILYGSITISDNDLDIKITDDVFCKSGSSIVKNFTQLIERPQIVVYGDWTFEAGSNVILDAIDVQLKGSTNTNIYNYSTNSVFYILAIWKTSASVEFSNLSTESLKINDVFSISDGNGASAFFSNSVQDIIVGYDGAAAMRNHSGTFQINNGELILNTSYTNPSVFNTGAIVNDLRINSNNSLHQLQSDNLTINGNLSLYGDGANFVDDITLKGNLDNQLDDEDDLLFNIITFNGTNIQYVENGFDSDSLIINKAGGEVRLVSDSIYCNYYDWIDGGIHVAGGVFTAGDLIDNGLFGSYELGTGGTINLTNNDGYIDLNGEINISGTGVMNIYGGTTDSYWAFSDDCTLNMSGGVLDFKNKGIDLDNHHNLTENITGGVIRTVGGFNGTQRSDFNPAGGTFEFYGTSNFSISQGAGNTFCSVEINKGVSASPGFTLPETTVPIPPEHHDPLPEGPLENKITLMDDLDLRGDMVINSGILDVSVSNYYIHVYGDWTNNVGNAGFLERQGRVYFEGSAISQILTDETFYHLIEDKTSTSFRALELGSGDGSGVDVSILGTLLIADGDMELNAPCTLAITDRVDIYDGSTLNANDAGTMLIRVGGDTWFDHNTTGEGFNAGPSSVVEFNRTSPTTYQQIIGNAPFNDILINSDALEVRISTSASIGGSLQCQDMVIQKGEFNPLGHTTTIADSLTIHDMIEMSHATDTIIVEDVVWKSGSSANIFDGVFQVSGHWNWESGTSAVFGKGNIVEFLGPAASLIKCQDDDASFGTVDINKPAGPAADTFIHAASTDTVRVKGDLTVRAGNQFHLQGGDLTIDSSLVNETGCEIDMTAGAFLEATKFLSINGTLDVGAGSVLVHDFFSLETTGQLIIDGGSMVTDVAFGFPFWCDFDGTLNMTDGILQTTNVNQRYNSTFSGTISGGTIRIGGAFQSSDNTFQPADGTVEFIYGGGHSIEQNNGCWFHNVTFNNNGQRVVYDKMTVKNDLLISAGGFNASDDEVLVGGNWTNNVGKGAFVEGTGTVFFDGTDPGSDQQINGETFYNLTNNNLVSELIIAGATTVTNDFNTGASSCSTRVAAPSLDVEHLLDNSNATLILDTYPPEVYVKKLLMGGTIAVQAGSFTADDLANSTIEGTYNIQGGTVNLSQDNTPGSFVHLTGNITMSNGTMYIRGGALDYSRWTGTPAPQLTMSGNSILDFTTTGIYIPDNNFTESITGGLIRCHGNFDINATNYTPAGGTTEIYGGNNYSINHLAGSNFHSLEINPGAGFQVQMLSDIVANGPFLLSTGTFNTNGYNITTGD